MSLTDRDYVAKTTADRDAEDRLATKVGARAEWGVRSGDRHWMSLSPHRRDHDVMPQMQSAWVDSGRSVDWGDVTRRALEAIKQLVPRSPRLSHDLSLRLKQVVASRTDDVLVRSATPEVAQRVEEMAVAVVEHGLPEPSILLAEDGSLGVDWRLPSGTTVGLFVGDIDAWEPVALITDDSIEEVEVHSVTELIDLLRKHT